jgi:hypothetical protein
MPAGGSLDDRKILIAGGVFLLVMMALALLLAPPPQQSQDYPSSYLASPGGAKAAYLLLQDLGYNIERWENPATALPVNGDGTTLILAAPFASATESDRQAVSNFLAAGGTVLATGSVAGRLIPESRDADAGDCEEDRTFYSAAFPSLLTRGAPEMTMSPGACWMVPESSPPALYAADGKAAALTYTVARGRVIWWASSEPLTNEGIRKPGNLAALLNALGPPGSARLLWDEYYHGYQGSLTSYLSSTPVPWALAQIGLLFAAVCATLARRSGPVRSETAQSRLSPLEFVETLGGLYQQGRARGLAVGVALQRFRFGAARLAGIPVSLSNEQLCAALEARLGRQDSGLRVTLRRCEVAMRDAALREADALRLVQDLHDHLAALRPGAARKG